mmetsp:Transcript_120/g.241  ORF Transcript_120/g.241 Transcript_120/m.241 type:complete len:2189 (+) Transcript_120:93-6659(+)
MLAVPVFNQVRVLVASLPRKTFRDINYELNDLINSYGEDARLFFLRCLLDEMDFGEHKLPKDHLKIQLVNQELSEIINRPNFVSLICRAIDTSKLTESYLSHLVKHLKLTLAQQVAMGLALTHVEDRKVAGEGRRYLLTKLPEIGDLGKDGNPPDPVLHELAYFLKSVSDIPEIKKEQYLQIVYAEAKNKVHIGSLIDGSKSSQEGQPVDGKSLLANVSPQFTLASAMKDLGPSCLGSKDSFKKVLRQFSRILPEDLAQAIGMMAQTSGLTSKKSVNLVGVLEMSNGKEEEKEGRKITSWNLSVFVDTIQELYPRHFWADIYQKFDYPEFYISDEVAFKTITDTFKKATTTSPFPLDPFLREWSNRVGQLSFIKTAISVSPGFFASSNSTQSPVEGMTDTKTSTSWTSLDFIEALLRLGDTEQYANVWAVLRVGLTEAPELLLSGVLQLRRLRESGISQELLSILIPQVLWDVPNTIPLLRHLWPKNREYLVGEIANTCAADKSFVPKAFLIASELNSLDDLLNAGRDHSSFSLDLACLASTKKKLDLEKWLRQKIAEHKEPFLNVCLEQVRKMNSKSRENGESEEAMTAEATALFTCLFEYTTMMSQANAQELQRLYNASERAVATTKAADASSADIEKEAHLYFKQIYEGKISLDEVIETLKKFKESNKKKESEMFACMIHALFDEYRFFAQYPEKELRITGILFGLLIKHRLVYNTTLGIALRYVLDALQKTADSNVFQFGMWAIEQFKERLHQWPQYCALIVEIPHLRQNYPELVSYIESAATDNPSKAQGQGEKRPPGSSSEGVPEIGQENGAPAVGPNKPRQSGWSAGITTDRKENSAQQTQVDVKAVPLGTPEKIKDKIHFLINNLSKANLQDKVKELKDFLLPPHYGYFSEFLVVKRVTQEANHLKMYATFLEKFDSKSLYKVIIDITYSNIKVVLSSDKIVASIDQRKLLKNLGSWLGLMTLARNRPILAKKLVLKELVLRAYSDGRLIAIIPFVAKVLEPTTQSRIFKPPNPWLMAILALLKEIMEVDNLKLNLKFAIECLFNHLHIEIGDVQPTSLLTSRPVHMGNLKPAENQPSPPVGGQEEQAKAETTPSRPLQGISPASRERDHRVDSDGKETPANLRFVEIHPGIPLFQQYPDLKNCVPIAVDKAIQDIIPVVERSVQIACVTTRQLIMKDFSMEQNQAAVRQAAHQMVRKLTSSLALVTCKEPLRVQISQNLASRLEEALSTLDASTQPPDRNMLEYACVKVSADNLELGCKLVEKAASDRAVYDIDEILSGFYMRKRSQPPYPSSFPDDLPENLKPKSGGALTQTQIRVYEDFGSSKVHPDIKAAAKADVRGEPFPANAARSTTNLPDVRADTGRGPGTNGAGTAPGTEKQGVLTNQQVLDNLYNAYFTLKKAIAAYPDAKDTPVTNLPKTSKAQEIHKIFLTFPQLLRAAREENLFPRQVMLLTFANKVFKELFAPDSAPLMISSQCAVLKYITVLYPAAIDRISEWLLAGDEPERKFVKPVITALIGNHLVDTRYVDDYFQKVLIAALTGQDTPQRIRELERLIDLSITLVRELVVKEQVLPPESFRNIIEVLLRLPNSVSAPFERSIQLLFDGLASIRPELAKIGRREVKHEVKREAQEMQQFKVVDFPVPVEDPEQQGLRQRVCYLLDDWLTICLEGTVSDTTYAQYLSHLRQQGLLQTTKSTNLFFRLITELCIEAAYSSKSQSQSSGLSYTTIDALAKLVVFLVKFLDNTNKIALLSAFLQVAAHVLIRDHDSKKNYKPPMNEFNQKPYLRLFTNLLYDLNTPDPSLDSSNIEVLNAFTHAFHTLRPSRVPAFAFAWMELISHRMFMPKLLISKPHRCSVMFKTLVVDQLTFLQPYLQNAELLDQVRLLYKGTLRILLVLLHDFPEFLCEFHFSFCDVIPTTCIQMRNLILSAFPRNVRLPDPLTPNLKVDLLPEITHPPRIGCDVKEALVRHNVLQPLKQYLASRQPTSFPEKLCEKLKGQPVDAKMGGSKYDVPLINSLVLHVGMQGIAKLQVKNDEGIVSQFQDNACMDIFEHLVAKLDPEGRYYVLNAIANQLRYPNNHTHYFSCVLLYLFLQSDDMFVKEQVTRVLLERLIVHQPHPWGLLITFIELIKNPQYEFGLQPFTNCAPEIARLFDSVARSCMPTKEDGQVHMTYGIDKDKLGR